MDDDERRRLYNPLPEELERRSREHSDLLTRINGLSLSNPMSRTLFPLSTNPPLNDIGASPVSGGFQPFSSQVSPWFSCLQSNRQNHRQQRESCMDLARLRTTLAAVQYNIVNNGDHFSIGSLIQGPNFNVYQNGGFRPQYGSEDAGRGMGFNWTRGGSVINNGSSHQSAPNLSNHHLHCHQFQFHANGSNSWLEPNIDSINDLKDKVILLAKDQIGCRFLRRKLEEGSLEEIDVLISEVKRGVKDILVNQFGNTIFQELLQYYHYDDMKDIIQSLIRDQNSFMNICIDHIGTFGIQKLIERVQSRELRLLMISALSSIALTLAKNTNGNHIIRQCMKRFPNDLNKPLLDKLALHCIEIAMDKSENYVVQFILELRIDQVTRLVISQLKGCFVRFSVNKYASNVVQKCLNASDDGQVNLIVSEITSNSSNFGTILQDPFGNYVAQSALDASKGSTYTFLVSCIKKHYCSLHSHPYGKRVLGKLNQKRSFKQMLRNEQSIQLQLD
ncbi:hypothetical protein Ancab_016967 [Ancistrocladus abbreviatus]